jgi:hypothetical protein
LRAAAAYARTEARTAAGRRRQLARSALGALVALVVLPLAAAFGRRAALRGWLRVCVQAGKLRGLLGRSEPGGAD